MTCGHGEAETGLRAQVFTVSPGLEVPLPSLGAEKSLLAPLLLDSQFPQGEGTRRPRERLRLRVLGLHKGDSGTHMGQCSVCFHYAE